MTDYTHIKKIKFLLALLLTMNMFSCKEDYEEVFTESTDQRVREVLDDYNQMLVDAPHGWKAMLYTGTGGGYFYYFDFDENGQVKMLSDFNETTAEEPMDGTWKLKALQRPTLSFDSYSYVHLPADPDGEVNGGADGQGLISDFEFAFTKTTEDSVIFKGIQRDTELVFIKANEQEASAILDGAITDLIVSTKNFAPDNEVLRMLLPNDKVVPVAINVAYKVFGIQYLANDGDSIVTTQSAFTFSVNGILLKSAVSVEGFTVNGLIWDKEKEHFVVPFEGESRPLSRSSDPYIFTPSTSLSEVIGQEYKAIQIPEGVGNSPLSGQSASFSEAYNAAATSMLSGLYNLTLREMNFVYDPAANTMYLEVIISQVVDGAVVRFLAQFAYSYTISPEGIIDYTFMGANENGWAIFYDMEVILNHIDYDTFKMEYVGGVFTLLGGQFSQEDPAFYFSGYLVP